MKAKVSVLTTVYNAEPYLAEALESILTQTFEDFEFILVDDGSSDSSPQIMRDYVKKDKRIRVLTLPDNRGTPYASNVGLKAARAPLIARMDGDDIALPERLRVQYDYMQKHSEVGVLGGQCKLFICEDPSQQKKFIPPVEFPTERDELDRRYKSGYFSVEHSVSMYRLTLAREAGGYREFFRYGAEDLDLFQRMADKSSIANLPDTLLWTRRGNSTSVFTPNRPRYTAALWVSILCSLSRQAGRKDPVTAVQSYDDLPAYLGLPRSVTLKDLQSNPYWAMRALRRQMQEHQTERATKRILYGIMTKCYKDKAEFADRKFYWLRYFSFFVERELLFNPHLHGKER